MKNYFIIGSIVLTIFVAGFFGFKMLRDKPALSTTPEASSNPVIETKSITLEEVAKHADANSCWIAIEGNVYDVTKFIPNHPGGDEIIKGCGKDATESFNNRPNTGTSHSSRARQMLQGFEIGVLAQ